MFISPEEILETIRMIHLENLDIRTVTVGISLVDCIDSNRDNFLKKSREKLFRFGKRLKTNLLELEKEFGLPIVNARLAITPISLVFAGNDDDYRTIAREFDKVAAELQVNFLGGFSALVQKGITRSEKFLIEALPYILSENQTICSSFNVASTRSGINADAVYLISEKIKQAAALSKEHDGVACAKLVVFTNAPEDNPFMAGAFHGVGEADAVLNIGISGPGVVRAALEKVGSELSLNELSEEIKKLAFKITRMGELIGREAARRLGIEFGVVDLSLAPTPYPGDSVAEILELIGVEKMGAAGSTAALMMLVDAVKKGGLMASSRVGGLSGAFIPVSEDKRTAEAVEAGSLSLEKLEAMTSVCSVGLDMVALPGDTSAETIAGIILDEMAIGVVNNKTTACRLIPVPGKKEGEWAEFGGLLGKTPIIKVNPFSCQKFVKRGGFIPAPLTSLRG